MASNIILEYALKNYYDFVLNFSKEVPVITTYGEYIDKEGNLNNYDQAGPYTEIIDRYFQLDYANIQKAEFMKEFGE